MRFFTLLSLLLLAGTTQLKAQVDKSLTVYTDQTTSSVFVYADNERLYPQTVKLELTLKGTKPKEKVPKYIIVPAGAKQFQLAELVIPERRSWSYSYRYLFFMGDVNTRHDDDHVYRLPYKTGESYRVVQGYFGQQSHAGERALDFDMEEGTEVVAARAGKVVAIKEDSDQGCPSDACAQSGNYVRIFHDDGTFADYYHLEKDGALVAPGDEVMAGDVIGLSGNTGWSSGPHLHFIVYRREENSRVTIATLFKTSNADATELKVKETYTAVNRP